MGDDRNSLDEWALRFAPSFLEMIGAPNGDEKLAAIGLDFLICGLPDNAPRFHDDRAALRAAQNALTAFRAITGRRGKLNAYWREETAKALWQVERIAAEQKCACFEPLSVTGTMKHEVWLLSFHMENLERAIEANLAAEQEAARERAHRPREEWKREAMFACVWLAYRLRLNAGLPDPVPSIANGALGSLFGFAFVELKVAEATAEKYARTAVALVNRVRKGLLSDDDRRFLCGVNDCWIHRDLQGELAAIQYPDEHTESDDFADEPFPGETVECEDVLDPMHDLRMRTGLW
jgi:hypothetical protein